MGNMDKKKFKLEDPSWVQAQCADNIKNIFEENDLMEDMEVNFLKDWRIDVQDPDEWMQREDRDDQSNNNHTEVNKEPNSNHELTHTNLTPWQRLTPCSACRAFGQV